MNDLISRQAAIDIISALIDDALHRHEVNYRVEKRRYEEWLNLLESEPAAEPNRKRGEWRTIVLTSYPPKYRKECTLCRYRACTSEEYNFCPNCGADMRGEEE